MNPLDLIKLRPLMKATRGHPNVVVGVIDGPVDTSHPALQEARIRAVQGAPAVHCEQAPSVACNHGTFVMGMLAAKREGTAPALCPQCNVVARPVFRQSRKNAAGMPSSTPQELARAIIETIAAGARVINLSVGLPQSSVVVNRDLDEAFTYACKRGVMLVVAAGNQGRIGYNPLLAHSWVLPVVACDEQGRPSRASNLSPSIGKRGLMAPAMHITSTIPGGRYTQMSGTSVAAPFVTGAIALLWSVFPTVTAAQIRYAILAGAAAYRGTITPPLLDGTAAWTLLKSRHRP